MNNEPEMPENQNPGDQLEKSVPSGSAEEIAQCAYCLWEQEGRPDGRALDHWCQAESQICARSLPPAQAGQPAEGVST